TQSIMLPRRRPETIQALLGASRRRPQHIVVFGPTFGTETAETAEKNCPRISQRALRALRSNAAFFRAALSAVRSVRAAASGRGRIDRQRHVLRECRPQTLDGAILVAAARPAADADGADHLSVDNNRDAAGDREEIKEHGRTR